MHIQRRLITADLQIKADLKNVKETQMDIKELFEKAENGTLTYEQFQAAAKEGKAKFVDLSNGGYVDKKKYEDDLKVKNTQIEDLNSTITSRDTDLAGLKKQLEEAGTDANKLSELNTNLSDLQSRYDNDIKSYQEKLDKQAYEFAVKEFANTKNFTSQAAKRDFINTMINEGLQMEGERILGGEDFVTSYSENNADAFVVEKDPEPTPTPKNPVPEFVAPTPGPTPSGDDDGFHFNFTGVRAKE